MHDASRSPDTTGALPAFAHVAPHLADANGRWFAWLTEPAGVYDFTPKGVMVTDEFSAFMEGPVTDAADAAFGNEARLLFCHDWRNVQRYSVTVRAKLVKWGLSHYGRTRVKTITALLADDSPMMVRMACTVGRTLMMAGDVNMDVRVPKDLTWENALRPRAL